MATMEEQTSGSRKKFQERPTESLIRSEFESLMSESEEEPEPETEPEKARRTQGGRCDLEGPGRTSFRNESTEDDSNEVILCLIWSRDRLGASYYDLGTSELFVLEDTYEDVRTFSTMRALYRQCQPRHVVTITESSAMFLACLKRLIVGHGHQEVQLDSTGSSEQMPRAMLRTLALKEYKYERCQHRVRCLRLSREPAGLTEEDRLTFLSGHLSFKAHAMIHSLGLLLTFLDQHWNRIALDPTSKPCFLALRNLALQDLVMISEDTYRALNIANPGDLRLYRFAKQKDTGGISLFLFLNRCRSRAGERFLWETLHHPTRDIGLIEQRLRTIDFFMNPGNRGIIENLTSSLGHIYQISHVVAGSCSRLRLKVANWQKLYKTVSYVIHIGDVCAGLPDQIELFRKIAASITNEMQCIKYFIEYVVDFEGSKRENSFVVRPNVDPVLDELNHVRNTLPQLLTQMGEKDMREHLPASVNGCNMLYLPSIGYVLAIKEWNPTPPEDMVFTNLEFKFSINRVRYYKSPSARELDCTVGDIMLKITKRQNQIMLKLMRYVNKHANQVLDSVRLCAELDTLLSFATVARDNGYVRPLMIEGQVIEVIEGRHPLQEHLTTFVANDIRSGSGRSRVKVLTGPNSSGKSIYLRQIGLIVFMAHIGSYVPAKSARIGLVTHILTQILSTDSILLNASSFLQDLLQINTALASSSPSSLVLIDEFGRGTSEVSGVTLLAAVLNSFLERGEECPHVFATTHLHQVLRFLPGEPILETLTFEYVANEDGTLAFLYRLASGKVQQSFAHAAAKSVGLNERIVERSVQVFEKLKKGVLPPRLPNIRRDSLADRILDRLSRGTDQEDPEELRRWIRQTVRSSVGEDRTPA